VRGSSISGLGGIIVLVVVDTAGRVRIMGHTHCDPPGALALPPIRRREGDLIHPAIAAPGAFRSGVLISLVCEYPRVITAIW
jgi:hypothetical protein